MQHNPPRVADDLQHTASYYGECMSWCTKLITLQRVCEKQQSENCNDAGVGCQ
jgi:hypothetical protein